MTPVQKRTFALLILIGLLAFVIFAFPNAKGAKTEVMLSQTSTDEPITYPIVERMLYPASDIKDFVSRWVIYGDYHYGYPFYFVSAMALLPIRLIEGAQFIDFTQLNLLLLRQMVSVLPMILALMLLVYMQTEFRSTFRSVALFVLLLTVRGLVRNNIQWWHPDALSVLAVVLVLFFLNRDRLRFGKDFYWAAAACGLATGIKLAGPFFVVTIFAYLVAGLVQHRLNLWGAIKAGLLFVLIMGVVAAVINPFLVFPSERQAMIDIQQFKTQELRYGYTHDDPAGYQLGPQFWTWTLTQWYGTWPWLAFFFVSLLAGCFWGPRQFLNRLILTWVIPYSIYLLWFVAVKPDHYWLPIIPVLFSGAFSLFDVIREKFPDWFKVTPQKMRLIQNAATLVLTVVLAAYVLISFTHPYGGILHIYNDALLIESGL